CKYENFPKRSETVDYTIEEIKNWLREDNNMIALHTSAKYGYEFVFNEIYKQLGLKVYVPDDRWRLYSKLSNAVPGVTNDQTRIHICRNSNENKLHTKCIKNCENKNFLYIHFSAMKWSNYEIDSKCINKVNANKLDVCFATHCSKSEVLYFINYFSPKKVVGFPIKYDDSSVLRESCNISVESNRETRKRECSFDRKSKSPKCVKSKKVDKMLLRKIFDD
ncbi:protein artemis-like, partial [Hyposmocoma kahamanoa]|uniref:protein artemis-like n=1 Tax=Hyposmocoma kahamanoa TaxID=1477025 RepID=UPI000E6D83D9